MLRSLAALGLAACPLVAAAPVNKVAPSCAVTESIHASPTDDPPAKSGLLTWWYVNTDRTIRDRAKG
jgi:hypothetical protein